MSLFLRATPSMDQLQKDSEGCFLLQGHTPVRRVLALRVYFGLIQGVGAEEAVFE